MFINISHVLLSGRLVQTWCIRGRSKFMDLFVQRKVSAGLGTILESEVPAAIDIYRIEHQFHGLRRPTAGSGCKNI